MAFLSSVLKVSPTHCQQPDWVCQARLRMIRSFPKNVSIPDLIILDTLQTLYIQVLATVSVQPAHGAVMPWNQHVTPGRCVSTTRLRIRAGVWRSEHIASSLLLLMLSKSMMRFLLVSLKKSVMIVSCGNSSEATAPKPQQPQRLLQPPHLP